MLQRRAKNARICSNALEPVEQLGNVGIVTGVVVAVKLRKIFTDLCDGQDHIC